MTEFNLSEKRFIPHLAQSWVYPEEDVKEFIKRLKEKFKGFIRTADADVVDEVIDKLSGDDLTEMKRGEQDDRK